VLAIHLSDGILSLPACVVGAIAAGAMVVIGGWRLREDEVPRVAVLSATFFVASLVRFHVPGGSVHLLLTGVVGLLLRQRSAVAIILGLMLQALLFQHGGMLTLGVNAVVMIIPAWLAGWGFALGQCLGWWQRGWLRTTGAALLGGSTVVLTAAGYWLALYLGSDDVGELAAVGHVVLAAHLPLAVLEGGLTAVVVGVLWQARPDLLLSSLSRHSHSTPRSGGRN
jgi:cobalt/nickel transport system permease protein